MDKTNFFNLVVSSLCTTQKRLLCYAELFVAFDIGDRLFLKNSQIPSGMFEAYELYNHRLHVIAWRENNERFKIHGTDVTI